MLPARYRMTRSAEFSATVKHGVRAGLPDLVVHARRDSDDHHGPRIGFVVSKSVGSAVDRHRVARRLRHAAKALLPELDPGDRLVIRALPGSRRERSARLQEELSAGLRRTRELERRR
ncbi:MAG: ribonuclease P protein component [Mycobacterium sp.]|nr:ribonuclease P protein component [Mycobacterium sp.]